jgi:hypothetical protein
VYFTRVNPSCYGFDLFIFVLFDGRRWSRSLPTTGRTATSCTDMENMQGKIHTIDEEQDDGDGNTD